MISRTKVSNLDGSLKFLHFAHVEPLLIYIKYCLNNNIHFDLSLQVLDFIVRHFEFQLFSSPKMLENLKKINYAVKWRLDNRLDTIGYNLAGLKFMLKEMSFTKVEEFDLDQLKA